MAEAAIANGAAALVAKNLSTFGAMQLVISAENGLVSICGSLSGGLFFFRRFLIHAKSFSIKHFGHFFNGAGNGIWGRRCISYPVGERCLGSVCL